MEELEMKDWSNEDKRNLILLSEIGVLLHDIGKYSKGFLENKVKIGKVAGFQHSILYNEVTPFLTKELQDILIKKHDIFTKMKIENRKSIASLLDFVTLHHPGTLFKKDRETNNLINIDFIKYNNDSSYNISEEDFNTYGKDIETTAIFPWLALLTQIADTLDSGIDKGFPQEVQRSIDTIHISSPFGKNKKKIDAAALEKERIDEFYKELVCALKLIDLSEKDPIHNLLTARNKLIALINEYWSHTLGETRIPSNDVRLHEHSLSTANIFKAELTRRLIEDDYELNWYDASKMRFQIIGIQWSWWDVTGRAFKIPDITGRSAKLEEIKIKLESFFQEGKKINETKGEHIFLPLGNAIYDDHNGIYFLIGSLDPEKTTTKDFYAQITKNVHDLFDKSFQGEVKYRIMRLSKPTNTLTHLTLLTGNHIDNAVYEQNEKTIKKADIDKITMIAEGPTPDSIAKLWKNNEAGGKEICQVCRIRPIAYNGKETDIGSDNYTGVKKCGFCNELAQYSAEQKENKKQLYVNEEDKLEAIKDEHRISLVSLKLDCDMWLSGSGFKSLKTNIITNDDNKNILKDILIEKRKKSPCPPLSVYSYEKSLNKNYGLEPPLRFNIKIQNETDNILGFFKNDKNSNEAKNIIWHLLCNQLEQCWNFGVFEGDMDTMDIDDAVNDMNTAFTMKFPSPSRLLRIINEAKEFMATAISELDKMATEKHFKFRRLVSSPIFLQVLLPAKQARAYIQELDKLYKDYFGFVSDRLPVHIRTVYFYYKTPLYIVMDAARRMFRQKAMLKKEIPFKVEKTETENKLYLSFDGYPYGNMELDVKPDSGFPDYYINYKRASDKHKESCYTNISRFSSNTDEIDPDKNFLYMPSTYDSIFLDTTTRRYDLFYNLDGKRPHYVLGTSRLLKVQFLHGLSLYQKLIDFLGDDTNKIKNLQGLMLEKHLTWESNDDDLLKGYFDDCMSNLYGKKWTSNEDFENKEKFKEMFLDFAVKGYIFDVMDQKLFIEA